MYTMYILKQSFAAEVRKSHGCMAVSFEAKLYTGVGQSLCGGEDHT